MRTRRKLVTVLSLLAGAVLTVTLSYGLYYRSDVYRHKVESKLSLFLGLPVEITAIRPQGLRSRELLGVQVWLPDHRGKVLECPRAVWDAAGAEGPIIHIYDAALMVGSGGCQVGDYTHLLQASLGRSFRTVPVGQISVHHGRIDWPTYNMQMMSAEGIDGRILFDERGSGQVQFTALVLNGKPLAVPTEISAQLDAHLDTIQFDGRVRDLEIDPVLSYFGLPFIGGKTQLTLSRSEIGPGGFIRSLKMAGECTGGSLAGVSQAYCGRAGMQGELRVRLNGLIFENGKLQSGDIDVFADPPAKGMGRIDRALLVDILQKQCGVSVPETLLPANIDFVNMGLKLLIDERHVRVLSARTSTGPALITARLLGQDIPLLGDLDQKFPLQPMLDAWQRWSDRPLPLSKAPAPASAPAPG